MEIAQVLARLQEIVDERNWSQFHSEANLAKSISIEAAELLENFQWADEVNRKEVIDELADVLTYSFLLADKLGVSPAQIVMDKLEQTQAKYPVDKARGRSTKYDRL
jgi:NTP pyrophosphatase (non-canonical NTP hydrolase)